MAPIRQITCLAMTRRVVQATMDARRIACRCRRGTLAGDRVVAMTGVVTRPVVGAVAMGPMTRTVIGAVAVTRAIAMTGAMPGT